MTILWQDIEGYEGMYKVSTEGDVMRLYKNGRCINKHGRSRYLKPFWRGRYLCVDLSRNNKQRMFPVSRLVAKAFIPNPNNKPEVNHKDGDRSWNSVSNLEWATESENSIHAYRNGLRKATTGTKNVQAKLNEEKVNSIRFMYHYRRRDGASIGTLAWMFEVSRQCISDIVHYRRWKHLPPPPDWK